MNPRVPAVIKKEFRHILRDPRFLFLTIFFPLIMILIYGYGVTMEAKNIILVVQDFDRSQTSRSLEEALSHYGYFLVKYKTTSFPVAGELIRSGRARAIVTIPENFEARLSAGRPQAIQIILDGADSNTAGIAQSYLTNVINSFFEKFLKQNGRGSFSLVELEPRVWFNPELNTNIFLVPGLIVIIMLLTTVLLTALAVVGEREQGTFEQLGVSPLSPREILIGKLLPYGIIAYFDFFLVVLVGHLVFAVPLTGNLFLLFLVAGIFIFGGLSLGLLISTVASNSIEAMMIANLSTNLPAFLLSGFVFPIANMPVVLQGLSYLIPARYFMVIIRGILLKGSGLRELWLDVIFLILFDVLVFNLAARRLKKGAILQIS